MVDGKKSKENRIQEKIHKSRLRKKDSRRKSIDKDEPELMEIKKELERAVHMQ